MTKLSSAVRFRTARRRDVANCLRGHSERCPPARRDDLLAGSAAKPAFNAMMSAPLLHGLDGIQRSVGRFRARPSVRNFLRLGSACQLEP